MRKASIEGGARKKRKVVSVSGEMTTSWVEASAMLAITLVAAIGHDAERGFSVSSVAFRTAEGPRFHVSCRTGVRRCLYG